MTGARAIVAAADAPSAFAEREFQLSPSVLLSELQARGARFVSPRGVGVSRVGGAGPSDHKAVTLAGTTVMVPIFTHAAQHSPFELREDLTGRGATLYRDGARVARVNLVRTPRFYELTTADGIPYYQIATLHAEDVLATTVLQHCVRYGNRRTACQFCAIGQSLAAGRTIAKKSPAQLAEVAAAAVALDGVKHMVLTTGTPPTPDRGARVLSECAEAITRRVALPLQAQCEPPDDYAWFERLRAAGVSSLGMHLEAVSEPVRARIMPGKAEVPVSAYLEAFARAVEVFGRGQVTTYVLAGLGDTPEQILAMAEQLVQLGVYPFVVPFVPIAGTPLEHHPPPDASYMEAVLAPLSRLLSASGMRSEDIAAGCGRCGACSTLRAREVHSC
jgi:radical SAM protein (TIGR04043 family)